MQPCPVCVASERFVPVCLSVSRFGKALDVPWVTQRLIFQSLGHQRLHSRDPSRDYLEKVHKLPSPIAQSLQQKVGVPREVADSRDLVKANLTVHFGLAGRLSLGGSSFQV